MKAQSAHSVVSKCRKPETQAQIIVLKFGGSVLKCADDMPEAASEIYRWLRQGFKVIAVTSALKGQTDLLMADAQRLACNHDQSHVPHYVTLGEEKSASLLAIACDRAGMCAKVMNVRQLQLYAHGNPHDSKPTELDGHALVSALQAYDVVIVPGFAGLCAHSGRTVMLGRGGTDMSAIFIAASLGLERVRLLKDVEGVFAAAGNADQTLVHKRVTWASARLIASGLVQEEALQLAEDSGVEIEIAHPGLKRFSIIGSSNSVPAAPRAALPKLRVAVAGCGVVGAGVIHKIRSSSIEWELSAVAVRRPDAPRDIDLDPALICPSVDALLESQPDIVVDTMSDDAAGRAMTWRCLECGMSVVSANKQALASDLHALNALAQKNGASLLISACVGGAAPIIEAVERAARAGNLVSIEAVLNGTVNFILSRLEAGMSFKRALAEAREHGFAEEDLSADLDGHDALAKLEILASAAWGGNMLRRHGKVAKLDEHCPQGIALRQISGWQLRNGELHGAIEIRPVGTDELFSSLRDEWNAVRIVTENGMSIEARGRGAGRWPTAEAVYADLMTFARQLER